MTTDPELERLLAERDATLAIYLHCMGITADARDAESDALTDANAAYNAYGCHLARKSMG
jgi:hypothetical protein